MTMSYLKISMECQGIPAFYVDVQGELPGTQDSMANCVIPDGNSVINLPSGFSHGESFKCTFGDSLLLMLISNMYHQKTLLKNDNWERILSFL